MQTQQALSLLKAMKKLSDEQIAAVLDVSSATVKEWQCGITPIPAEVIERLSQLFLINPLDFYEIKMPMPINRIESEATCEAIAEKIVMTGANRGYEYTSCESEVLKALILYIWHKYPKDRMLYREVINLCKEGQIENGGYYSVTSLDKRFYDLEKVDPGNKAVEHYKIAHLSPAVDLSRALTAIARDVSLYTNWHLNIGTNRFLMFGKENDELKLYILDRYGDHLEDPITLTEETCREMVDTYTAEYGELMVEYEKIDDIDVFIDKLKNNYIKLEDDIYTAGAAYFERCLHYDEIFTVGGFCKRVDDESYDGFFHKIRAADFDSVKIYMKPAIEYLCALTVKVTLIPMAFTMVDGLPIENSLKEDIKDKIGWFIETVIDPKTPGDKAALYMQKELVDYDEDISLREVDDIIGLRKTALYRKEERYGALTNKEELEKTMRMFVESLKKKDAIQQLQSKSFALTADDAMEKLKSFGLNAIEKKEKNGTKDIKEASVDKPSVDDITTAEDGKKTVKKTDDGAGNPTTVKKKQDT